MPDGLDNAVYAGIGILLAVVGATIGIRMVRRRELLRRPGFLTLLGSGVGLVVIGAGFARYLFSAMPAGIERVESCVAVFIGGLVFASSVIAFFKLRGAISDHSAALPGYRIVDVVALLLYAWLGYAFVTEDTQNFGVAALLAMSVLAAALGAHLMTTADDPHLHAFAASGGRAHVRCGVVHRRGMLARIELRGDPSHSISSDDFSTPCWALCDDACDVQRSGAYRRGAEWRYRGRQRYRALRQ
jgi:H+-translocating NAD(P) transhydrogenase subunit beta